MTIAGSLSSAGKYYDAWDIEFWFGLVPINTRELINGYIRFFAGAQLSRIVI